MESQIIENNVPIKANQIEYPCLLRSKYYNLDYMFVVLASEDRHGTVVQVGAGCEHELGDFSNTWLGFDDPEHWEVLPAKEAIQLSN